MIPVEFMEKEEPIDIKKEGKRIVKYISLCISTATIIYSLAWLIFNFFHIVKDTTPTLEVKITVYALLSLFNAIAVLVLLYLGREKHCNPEDLDPSDEKDNWRG